MQELKNIDWDKTLEFLIGFATSSEGKEKLGATSPLKNPDEAKKSFLIIEEFQNLLKNHNDERPSMESLDLFHSWFLRLKKNALLKTIELKDIRSFLLEVDYLNKMLQSSQNPRFESIKSKIMPPEEPISAINQLINFQGDIRSDASENLYKFTREKKQLAMKVQKTLDDLVKGHNYDPVLQEKYITNREGRWVIPVKSGMRHELEGIIHDSSSSKQTVFMEPKIIIPLNNRIKEVEIEIQKEIEKLLMEISDYLFSHLQSFYETKEIMLSMDCFLSKAQLTKLISAHPVEFSEDSIKITDMKHPLMIAQGEKVVPNNLHLDKNERILILSGPNAGGKTVLLKAFGLICHMARCGLPVSTGPHSVLPFFEKIFVAVGDNQSVDQNLSTFASHLNILHQACGASGFKSLILIDEICGSTDPQEGAALARGFIEHYAKQNVFSLITSHLSPLKMGWEKNSGIINGSMNYDTQSGSVTYQFIRGLPGQSFAFAMAKKIGILESIYKKAKAHLSPAGQKRLQFIEEMEKMKKDVVKLKTELEEQIAETRKEQSKYRKKTNQFELEKKQRMEREISQWMEKVKKEIREKKIKNIFESHQQREEINMNLPEVIKTGSKAKEDSHQSLEKFVKQFPPGSPVFISNLNRDGIIQGEANSKGELPVLSGFMRLFIHWKLLEAPRKISNSPKKNNSHSLDSATKHKDHIDLRGLKPSEAVEKLEITLDKAQLNNLDRLKVIHGWGTLKKTILSHLSRSLYVTRWQTSSPEEGVTLVYLKGNA